METIKESVSKKGKRPKSATRYPKKMPTYVVAFSVQESRDDPAKNPLTLKRSTEKSTSSIKSLSPSESTNSAKTFTITPTDKLSHVLSIPTISEVKIDIKDSNQYGDVDKTPPMSSYIVVDNITTDEQPEVIFNAPLHKKSSQSKSIKLKDDNKFPRKKPKKSKRVIKFKNIHFKYKNSRHNISRRLEKCYKKINSPSSEELKICGLSNIVCKSRDLKKVLAKSNLLDESDRISFCDEYEDGSPASSPSTTKKSFVSYTSQNTLIQKSSSSSRNEDFYSIKTANSVIQVASEVMPYKHDVINVAVALAFNPSKQTSNPGDSSNSNEIFMHKENLTSDDTFLLPYVDLTSGTPSHDTTKVVKPDLETTKPNTLNENEISTETLTGFEKKSLVGICSDDDTFVIARTSSDFNKSSINSEFTITSTSDSTLHAEVQPNLLSQDKFSTGFPHRTTLSDTVRSLGFYPEMAPSTSYDTNFKPDKNGVIVTENIMTSFSINPKNKGDLPANEKNNLSKNVLRKNFDVEKLACLQKNIDLPNDVTIKANLKETNIGHQKKQCFEEIKTNKPTDLAEMWERLILILDLAVTRLEETLADKILKELKKSLEVFKQPEPKPNLELEVTELQPIKFKEEVKMSHKEVSVLELKKADFEIDESLQCDLVQNQVIDQLMLKLSVEAPKPIPLPTSSASLKKLKKPQIVKDYFETLKPPESALIEVGKGDQVTVSTATAEIRSYEASGLHRVKVLFSGPMSFIKENVFVITSVPTFFIVLLCLYGIIVIIMKPW